MTTTVIQDFMILIPIIIFNIIGLSLRNNIMYVIGLSLLILFMIYLNIQIHKIGKDIKELKQKLIDNNS